ncbi:Hpt domain-containing protein [Lunatibacter salilacus]|uniref:Hpt domain-containing protein n=1 Tax=Lunatibacter salilacus TaxID=2483804 RepID=UPI00131D37FC|nr:Hpt domain-containing protein [Lunatibacter salilacus]
MDSQEQSEKLYNLSNLEEISGGSEDFIRQMIILFLEQAASSISGLEKGVAENDITLIKNLAHQLKPSVDNFRITDLSQWIREVEHLAENNPESSTLSEKISQSNSLLRRVMVQLENHFA